MEAIECMETRRSIRRFLPDSIPHSILDTIVSVAAYSPSWKNSQITRYTIIENAELKSRIADEHAPAFNAAIINSAPVLVAVSYVNGICGFEKDGSYTTLKKEQWQMFDVGAACQTFCLAAHEQGLGTVIMGIFDEAGITDLLKLPDNQTLATLIAIGYPDQKPSMPQRKPLEELITYL